MTDYARHDYRCTNCGRLQFRAYLPDGTHLETRCPKCGHFLIVVVAGQLATMTAQQIQVVGLDIEKTVV